MPTALTVRQEQVAAERATYTGAPTARMTKAAELIKGSKAGDFKKPKAAAAFKAGLLVEAAMLEVGYGARYVEGSAKAYPGVLVNAGLLTEGEATGATPEPVPAPKVKKTEDKETIQ